MPGAEEDRYDRGVAPERTALAWNRTSLSFGGMAALVARLLWKETPAAGLAIATLLFALAAVAYVHGRRSYDKRLVSGAPAAPPVVLVRVVAIGTALIALAIVIVEVIN